MKGEGRVLPTEFSVRELFYKFRTETVVIPEMLEAIKSLKERGY